MQRFKQNYIQLAYWWTVDTAGSTRPPWPPSKDREGYLSLQGYVDMGGNVALHSGAGISVHGRFQGAPLVDRP